MTVYLPKMVDDMIWNGGWVWWSKGWCCCLFCCVWVCFTWVGLLQQIPAVEGPFLLVTQVWPLLHQPVGDPALTNSWKEKSRKRWHSFSLVSQCCLLRIGSLVQNNVHYLTSGTPWPCSLSNLCNIPIFLAPPPCVFCFEEPIRSHLGGVGQPSWWRVAWTFCYNPMMLSGFQYHNGRLFM